MIYVAGVVGCFAIFIWVFHYVYQMGKKEERGSHAERIHKAAITAMHTRRRILSDPNFRQRMREKYK